MLHPSYTELMEKINKEGETGEEPVINSRYSIVIATSKRAREIIAGDEPLVNGMEGEKPYPSPLRNYTILRLRFFQEMRRIWKMKNIFPVKSLKN